MKINFRVNGVIDMANRLKAVRSRFPLETANAMKAEMLIEKNEVYKRTPKLHGFLRGTEKVEEPVIQGTKISCRIIAGGPEAPYAVYVHEDLEAHHPIGQAKFLESVILESRAYFFQRVAKRVDFGRSEWREWAKAS